MARHSRTEATTRRAATPQDAPRARARRLAARVEERTAARTARLTSATAVRSARAAARTADLTAARNRRDAEAAAKIRRADAAVARKVAAAQRKASKAAAKASKAAAAEAATRPARVLDRITDPGSAKRMVTIGKILAPALAPLAVKAAVGLRGYLDHRRAERLGVALDDIAQFRGPTGATGARIRGLAQSLAELAARKGNELQVTRFTDVSQTRLTDLTAATQAAATMPHLRRRDVLRAINRELDGIDADLIGQWGLH